MMNRHDPELISTYLIDQAKIRYGNQWKGNYRKLLCPWAHSETSLPPDWIWHEYTLRKVSCRVNYCLNGWLLQSWPLLVIDWIPSPWEMLEWQAQGIRCLTFPKQPLAQQQFLWEQKDLYHFLIHDLEHAYEFFHRPYQYQQQQHFFQSLLQRREELQAWCLHTPEVKPKLHYLMSDMNSHVDHLKAYLHHLEVTNGLPSSPSPS